MAGRIADEIQNKTELHPTTELILNVYRTSAALHEWTTTALEPVDLRPEEYNILRILRGAEPDGHARAEIERRMLSGTDRLTTSLHRLKSRNLVEGVFQVRITADGLKVLSQVDGLLDSTLQERMKAIPPTQLKAAITVLEQLRQVL
jgi:DNA-binding MarR family transcriptional regulator